MRLINSAPIKQLNLHCFSQGTDDQGNVSQLIEDFHAERYQLELARDDYKIKCESLEVRPRAIANLYGITLQI